MSDDAKPVGSLRERIRDYVLSTDHVSFAELGNRFGAAFRDAGESGAELCKGDNVVLWSGLTPEAVEAICGLLNDGELEISPCGPLVYLLDGVTLSLPILKRPPRKPLTKPHWVPAVLRPPQPARGKPAKRRGPRA